MNMQWPFESLVLVPLKFCLDSKYTFMYCLSTSPKLQVTEIIIIVEVFFGLKANNIVKTGKRGRNGYIFLIILMKLLARKIVFLEHSLINTINK